MRKLIMQSVALGSLVLSDVSSIVQLWGCPGKSSLRWIPEALLLLFVVSASAALWESHFGIGREWARGLWVTRRLNARLMRLGRDLIAFLREIGPDPIPDESLSMTERVAYIGRISQPRSSRILSGYEHRFKSRISDVVNELRDSNRRHSEMNELSAIRQINSFDPIERIAKACYLLAAEVEWFRDYAPEKPNP